LPCRNATSTGLQVDTIDASGARVGLGSAAAKTLTTFQEIPDIGQRWTFVASYAGRQVHRVTITKTEFAARGWTVTIPAGASSANPASVRPTWLTVAYASIRGR
jgi:hypothetical protein